MALDVEQLAISDIKIFRPKKFEDSRGFFSETYSKKAFADLGIDLEFVQDNHALSQAPGTVRGLHFQGHPFAQDKLVRVVRGRIFDVAVDLRRNSPTFGRWVAAEISAEQWNQILIPVGFAHGLCTLEPGTEVLYKVTNYYSPQHDFGVRWNDTDIGVAWPVSESQVQLSEKDRRLPLLRELAQLF
jgi:dTDP-4-dehydrorhamnose 3,5-epimerase